MINKQIHNYRITHLIDERGIAKVYEAEHVSIGNKVAIKILDPVLAKQGKLRERFHHEARIMAGLDHPFFIRVFDFIEEEGIYAIVMELIKGEKLSDLAERNGAFSWELTYALMLKLLDAFAYGLDKGLIHQDIKPSNIYLLEDNSIKILGFGIARPLEQEAKPTSTAVQIEPNVYMSPEQLKGNKHIDYLSNIYSLGVMMDFMLNGKTPYDTANVSSHEIFNEIVENPLPKTDKYLRYSRIIRTATAINPERRFQSYEKIVRQLTNAKNKPEQLKERAIRDGAKRRLKDVSDKKDNKLLLYVIAVALIIFFIWRAQKKNINIKTKENTKEVTDSVIDKIIEEPAKNKFINEASKHGYLRTEKGVAWTDKENGIYTDKRDGKKYKVVKIGSQIWMAENLNYTKGIPKITDKQQWVSLKDNRYDAAWCYYDNKSENGKNCGALYTYAAALKVAPKGWHLPTKEEYETLFNYYGNEGEQVYRAIIKKGGATFNIIFCGWRGSYGYFSYKNDYTGFWSATEDGDTFAWNCYFESTFESTLMFSSHKSIGFSVRLIRD